MQILPLRLRCKITDRPSLEAPNHIPLGFHTDVIQDRRIEASSMEIGVRSVSWRPFDFILGVKSPHILAENVDDRAVWLQHRFNVVPKKAQISLSQATTVDGVGSDEVLEISSYCRTSPREIFYCEAGRTLYVSVVTCSDRIELQSIRIRTKVAEKIRKMVEMSH